MDATKVRDSRLCECKTCRCYSLVSPLGGTCGGCLTGLHYTYGSRPPEIDGRYALPSKAKR